MSRRSPQRPERPGEREGQKAEARNQFVERFAGELVLAGVPRMPARVYATLLVADDGRLTSAELAERLQISPAGVSGAVRYLEQVELIRRERPPGSRRDHYRVPDLNAWYEMLLHREQLLARWADVLGEGVDALGATSPAGRRLADTQSFIAFLQQEMPKMLARWRRQRARREG